MKIMFSKWKSSNFFAAVAAFFLVGVGALPVLAAPALGFTGKIYDIDSNKQKLLFTYKHEFEAKDTGRLVSNTISDLDGKPVVVETAQFFKVGDKEKIQVYRMSQKQLGTEGSVEIKDGEAHFSYTKDGTTKTAKEKAGDDFITGPSLVAYLREHWGAIKAGKAVKARFAVLDRLETVGFEFSKESETDLNGTKAIVVKMKPSSFIIAALVKPLHFYLAEDGSRLLELRGRTQAKRNEGGKWKDLDAVTVYEY